MISIVICSRGNVISPLQAKNIEETIGLPYEVIWMNGTKTRYSLFAAFNDGASMSKYDILCFMHDDIMFHTSDWGKIVQNKLSDEQTGVLGVAGSIIKTHSPSPWWISNNYLFTEYLRSNIIQKSGPEKITRLETINPKNERMSQVEVLDGVWMCCRKNLWIENRFDETRFSHFHFYDMDFSLNSSSKGYKNYVLYDVLIEHDSTGNLDRSWIEAAEIFTKKWKKILPVSLQHVSKKVMQNIEYEAIKNYLLLLSATGYGSFLFRLNYWLKTLFLKRFKREHLSLLKTITENL